MNPTLALTGVTRLIADRVPVLDRLDLTVEAGEVIGLVGKNGVGKTTLMRLVMGVLPAHGGQVRVFGLDPRTHPVEVKRRIGFVSETQVLPGHLRARDVMDMHAELFPTWDKALALRLKERFEIHGPRRVNEMSKGQARHLAVTCAIAHRPELLLLDEPASGFDPAARRSLMEAALEHLNDTGSAIIFSSHQLGDVERLSSRVAFLHGGRWVFNEPLDTLCERASLVSLSGAGADPSELRKSDGCVTARKGPAGTVGLFVGAPDEIAAQLDSALTDSRPHVRMATMEEIFIELAESRVQPRRADFAAEEGMSQ